MRRLIVVLLVLFSGGRLAQAQWCVPVPIQSPIVIVSPPRLVPLQGPILCEQTTMVIEGLPAGRTYRFCLNGRPCKICQPAGYCGTRLVRSGQNFFLDHEETLWPVTQVSEVATSLPPSPQTPTPVPTPDPAFQPERRIPTRDSSRELTPRDRISA